MANLGFDDVLVPAGTVATASGVGAGFELDDKDQWRGQVTVTAASGTTPSLTVNVQTSHDNGATDAWRTVASFAALTAAGSSPWNDFAGLDRWVRATWTITGTTPSFTFGVAGEAV